MRSATASRDGIAMSSRNAWRSWIGRRRLGGSAPKTDSPGADDDRPRAVAVARPQHGRALLLAALAHAIEAHGLRVGQPARRGPRRSGRARPPPGRGRTPAPRRPCRRSSPPSATSTSAGPSSPSPRRGRGRPRRARRARGRSQRWVTTATPVSGSIGIGSGWRGLSANCGSSVSSISRPPQNTPAPNGPLRSSSCSWAFSAGSRWSTKNRCRCSSSVASVGPPPERSASTTSSSTAWFRREPRSATGQLHSSACTAAAIAGTKALPLPMMSTGPTGRPVTVTPSRSPAHPADGHELAVEQTHAAGHRRVVGDDRLQIAARQQVGKHVDLVARRGLREAAGDELGDDPVARLLAARGEQEARAHVEGVELLVGGDVEQRRDAAVAAAPRSRGRRRRRAGCS